MDDAIEEGKHLLSETVRAFRTGTHGHEYVPGVDNSAALDLEDQLAKLTELRDAGTLTKDEFEDARTRLLAWSWMVQPSRSAATATPSSRPSLEPQSRGGEA